jgi:hypothetical protein
MCFRKNCQLDLVAGWILSGGDFVRIPFVWGVTVETTHYPVASTAIIEAAIITIIVIITY